jgi:RHS repeat-associated protein
VVKTILPDLREVRFEYDLNGNLTKVTPPTRPDHTFEHNDVDQVERYEPPDLEPETPEVPATTYAYDRDHRLTTITRPDGQVVAVQYDAGGRVDAVVAPTHTIDLAYDSDTGKLASIAGPDGTTVAYDYDGPWVEEVTIAGPFAATVQLEPDRPQPGFPATNFWLGRLTVNDDPTTEIEVEYDDDGLPTRIEEMDLFFDAASGRWLGSHVDQTGVRVTRNAFAEAERLEAGFFGPPHVSSGQPPHVGSRLLDVTYERDKTGRITRKTERMRTEPGGAELTRVHDYEYDDDRGWLTEVKRDGVVVETYGYDANGNRASWTTDFGSGTATYDEQDRLLTYGGLSFTYTENGELLTKSNGSLTTSYTYDAFSNLRSVTLPDGIEIEYLIDGKNRRIGTKVDGVLVQRFVYLGGLAPIAELDENGAVTTQYVYGSGVNVPDYFVRGGVVYRVFTDHLGSVRYVVDAATGEVVQRMEYDSFGRVTLDTNPGFQPFGFAGGLYDRQTGLVRFGARDYDVEIGRWTTKDPIGFSGGLGIYTYVGNDPVNLFDPGGLASTPAKGYRFLEWIRSGAFEEDAKEAGRHALSVIAGFFPYVGEIHDGSQVVFGRDFISGEDLSGSDQVLAGAGFFVPFVGGKIVREIGGPVSRRLFHGTDAESARSIVATGLDRKAAAQLGGGDVFWMTESQDTARIFAQVNPASGNPAVVAADLEGSVIESLADRGVIRFDNPGGAWQVLDWEAFNEVATFVKVE